MFILLIADQLIQWAKDSEIEIQLSNNYTIKVTENVTEMVNQMPPQFKTIAQSTFGLFDTMLIFIFIVFGVMFVFRFVTSDWFERYERRHRTNKKLKTKSIPIHKRLMLRFGLAEVKEYGKK